MPAPGSKGVGDRSAFRAAGPHAQEWNPFVEEGMVEVYRGMCTVRFFARHASRERSWARRPGNGASRERGCPARVDNQSGLRPVAGGTPALPGSQPAFGSGCAGLGAVRRTQDGRAGRARRCDGSQSTPKRTRKPRIGPSCKGKMRRCGRCARVGPWPEGPDRGRFQRNPPVSRCRPKVSGRTTSTSGAGAPRAPDPTRAPSSPIACVFRSKVITESGAK